MVDERRVAPQVDDTRSIAEAQEAVRTTIGEGLRQRLEVPKELPPDIASLRLWSITFLAHRPSSLRCSVSLPLIFDPSIALSSRAGKSSSETPPQ
jgi:hypothetical protein